MAISQQKFREIVFQLLFSQDFVVTEEEEIVDFMMQQLAVTKKTMKEAQGKWRSIVSHISEIDEMIRRFSSAYDLERIAKVEKSVLRLGVYELCFETGIPPVVAIAEAIRLTRKFATAESSTFVNAVLDALYQDRSSLSEGKDVCLATVSVG